MCLDRLDSPEQMKKYLQDKPEEFTVYKVVKRHNGKLFPLFWDMLAFRRGINITNSKDIRTNHYVDWQYCTNYHSFEYERDAEDFGAPLKSYEVIFPVKVKKKDITATGFQDEKRAIVSRRIYIDPKIYDKAVGK